MGGNINGNLTVILKVLHGQTNRLGTNFTSEETRPQFLLLYASSRRSASSAPSPVAAPSLWVLESGSCGSEGPAATASPGPLSSVGGGSEAEVEEEEGAAGWELSSPSLAAAFSSSSRALFLLHLGLPGEASAAPGGTAGSAMMLPCGRNMWGYSRPWDTPGIRNGLKV